MFHTAKIQALNIQEAMTSRHGQYLAYCIIVLMALLIVTKIYQGLSFFAGSSQITASTLQIKPLEKLPRLSEFHLFGIYQPAVVNISNLPATTLNLKLEGVFAAIPESKSFAIISVLGSEGKLYRVNAELPGDAKLYRILDNSVIISRNGRLESLTLPGEKIILGKEPHSLDLPSNSN